MRKPLPKTFVARLMRIALGSILSLVSPIVARAQLADELTVRGSARASLHLETMAGSSGPSAVAWIAVGSAAPAPSIW